MNNFILQNTLKELHAPDFILQAYNATLTRIIASEQNEYTIQITPEKLTRYGFVYERQGLDAFSHFTASQEKTYKDSLNEHFNSAYICWRSLLFLTDEGQQSVNGHVSGEGLRLVRQEFEDEMLPPDLILAFRLSIAGLLSGHIAETRFDLQRFPLNWYRDLKNNWRETVTENIFSAFVRLVRKANGWDDIQQAMDCIAALHKLQKSYEEAYLKSWKTTGEQKDEALVLVGCYHLAQLITLTGDYLRTGAVGYDKVSIRLDRHHEQSVEALEMAQQPVLAHLADLLWAGCRELLQNAIWAHLDLGLDKLQMYVHALTAHDRAHPVIELWPSQQEALQNHLFDLYPRAILVEMPTSAGKTLLAKFMIAQTKSLHSQGLIIYIVPTRALVNQVTFELRQDFSSLDFRVELAVPAFELDPTEARLLQGNIDILVTTPEKLDLLIRSDHPIVENIVFVVADEAHNITDGPTSDRGARLELLLGTIKRDFPKARFLLLSPFLPNAKDLVQWLGENRTLPPIEVKWEPTRKLVGVVKEVKKQKQRQLVFETCATAHNPDILPGRQAIIDHLPVHYTTIHDLSRATAHALLHRGSVLILCDGPTDSMKRAKKLAEERPRIPNSDKLEAVCHYIEAELGKDCLLATCLQHGIAYHHGGLSQETRWLIEGLIRDSIVEIICGTTTLAQGVNFPITTVIIETLSKGRGKLSFQDFWNIAGRAGRTLVDTLGVVAFPTPTSKKQENFENFLKEEAQEIVSQLVDLIEKMNELANVFSLSYLRDHRALSPLLQFLAHAMRVSGNNNLADEVEELLRSSLVYHQLRKLDKNVAAKLIMICRMYLEQTREHKNILGLADRTGFATPSVLSMLALRRENMDLAVEKNWHPDYLFGENLQPLIRRIEIIADLPEIHLDEDERGIFNTHRVAGIVRDWVNGVPLEELANVYGNASIEDNNRRISNFSNYLFKIIGRASWGIGALETTYLGGNEAVSWSEVGYIPSMIFFGVRQKEAIPLRMIGVPRIVASNLAGLWRQNVQHEPDSYEAVRSWVTNLSDRDWRAVVPKGSTLTPKDMRLIWKSFSGIR